MHLLRAAAFLGCALLLTTTADAQWPPHMPANVPKTPDGKPDLSAPAPRLPDGKVDLSGVWEPGGPGGAGRGAQAAGGRGQGAAGAGAQPGGGQQAPPGRGQGGAGGQGAAGRAQGAGAGPGRGAANPQANVFGNIGAQIDGGAPYQPWAADLVKKRMADNSKDNPDAHCLPMGIMQLTAHPYPKKIIQTPTEVLLIYEGSGTTVREVYLDGRPLPAPDKVEPWWNGYSVGHWEDNDTLVVETTGFMDDGWLDVRGSPLTSAGKITERYRRPTYGSLEIEVTIDDPKAYTKPFKAVVRNRLMPDAQLIEFVCIDKDAQHYVPGDANK